jgi:hypothetical protein
MAANNLELALKIQALVNGLEEVQRLTSEMDELGDTSRQSFGDPTEETRAGADETADALGDISASAAKALAALGGFAAIAGFFKNASQEAADYEERFLTLEQTIRATGGAAGFSADEIRAMSQEMALATLGSVEGFEKAATTLLTFKSVAGDTFTQTLALAQDLAQAGFGSLEQNAIQLGKALEDPVKGLDSLRRTGVTFSDDQREVVKQLVETGKAAEAQALILEAVAGQVGGVGKAAAEGLAGAYDTLAQRFEEVRLAAGDAIEPAMTAFYEELSAVLVTVAQNMDVVVKAASVLGAALLAIAARSVIGTIGSLAVAIAGMGTAAGGAAVSTRLLGAAMRGLPLLGTIAAITELLPLLLEWRQVSRDLAAAEDSAADSQARLAAKLAEISTQTGVTVTSMRALEQAVKDGRIHQDATTGAWHAGSAAAAELAAKAAAAAAAVDEQTAAARRAENPWATAAVKAQEIAAGIAAIDLAAEGGGEQLKALIGALDLTSRVDLSAAIQGIGQLETTAKDAATAAREELLAAIRAADEQDFNALIANLSLLKDELRLAGADSQTLADVLDTAVTEAARRAGIEINEALGQITPATSSAIDAITSLQTAMEAAGYSAADMGKAVAAALEEAAKAATTDADIEALRQQLQALGDQGVITVGQVGQVSAAIDKAALSLDSAAASAERTAAAFDSMSLDEVEAEYNRLALAVEKSEKAISAGADAQERLAAAQADAELKAAAYADAMARGADDAGRYAQAAKEAQEYVTLLTDEIAKGRDAQAKDAQLKADMADAADALTKATDAAAAAIDRQVESIKRDNDIAQAKIDLQIKQLEREQALAEAKGETARAAEIALDIARLEVDAANQSAQAMYAQAEALAQKADMAERAAQADGILTDEERDMIDALRDAAEMAKIEAQSMDVSTQSKEDNAKAAEKAADASRDQAAAARDNAQAQEEEKAAIDENNAAKSDSEDSSSGSGQTWTHVNDPQSLAQQFNPETNPGVNVDQELKDYLYSWTDGGAGSSEYVGNILNEVKEIWEQERKDREESASAASLSADAAKSSADVAQAFADIYGTGPLASQASADTNATSSASTSAQPVSIDTRSIEASITSALQNMSVAPVGSGGDIIINIEGVLDINDSATLDSLARKLQPIFADLTRRGL